MSVLGGVPSAIEYGDELTLVCDAGYSADGAAEQVVTCAADGAEGVLAITACVEDDCPAIETIGGGFTVDAGSCATDEALAAGTTCSFACSSGKITSSAYTHVTCSKGALSMC